MKTTSTNKIFPQILEDSSAIIITHIWLMYSLKIPFSYMISFDSDKEPVRQSSDPHYPFKDEEAQVHTGVLLAHGS